LGRGIRRRGAPAHQLGGLARHWPRSPTVPLRPSDPSRQALNERPPEAAVMPEPRDVGSCGRDGRRSNVSLVTDVPQSPAGLSSVDRCRVIRGPASFSDPVSGRITVSDRCLLEMHEQSADSQRAPVSAATGCKAPGGQRTVARCRGRVRTAGRAQVTDVDDDSMAFRRNERAPQGWRWRNPSCDPMTLPQPSAGVYLVQSDEARSKVRGIR
jgi:hypothetical protein